VEDVPKRVLEVSDDEIIKCLQVALSQERVGTNVARVGDDEELSSAVQVLHLREDPEGTDQDPVPLPVEITMAGVTVELAQ
jgi:hypothetical protein